MSREVDQVTLGSEMATFRGVLMAFDAGYRKTRVAELRSKMSIVPARPNDGSWARAIARDFPTMVTGMSADGPMAAAA